MNAVTLKDAKLNLERLIERVIADAEPTIVVTESGKQVVLLPLDEYNSWKEAAGADARAGDLGTEHRRDHDFDTPGKLSSVFILVVSHLFSAPGSFRRTPG